MRKLSSLAAKSGIYEIDPEGAAKLLETPGAKNRPLTKKTVARYARRMKDRLWSLSGEPIILNANGGLLDGEHRLTACVEAGVAFQTVVLFGEFQFKSMGQGRGRTGGDLLALAGLGLTSPNVMAAVAGLCIVHERALRGERSPYGAGGGSKGGDWADLDNAERAAWARKNPRAEEIFIQARTLTGNGRGYSLVPMSPLTAAWYLAEGTASAAEAEAFFSGLVSGAGLGANDVRLKLRANLSNRVSQGHGKPTGMEMLHWLAKAWHQRDKEARKIFHVKTNESFPFFR